MLWTIVAVLLILWLLGFSMHIAGGLVHILLVVALIAIVFNLLSGRRTARDRTNRAQIHRQQRWNATNAFQRLASLPSPTRRSRRREHKPRLAPMQAGLMSS